MMFCGDLVSRNQLDSSIMGERLLVPSFVWNIYKFFILFYFIKATHLWILILLQKSRDMWRLGWNIFYCIFLFKKKHILPRFWVKTEGKYNRVYWVSSLSLTTHCHPFNEYQRSRHCHKWSAWNLKDIMKAFGKIDNEIFDMKNLKLKKYLFYLEKFIYYELQGHKIIWVQGSCS